VDEILFPPILPVFFSRIENEGKAPSKKKELELKKNG
jgi:hypothetical protein